MTMLNLIFIELLNKSTNSDKPTIHTNTLNQGKKTVDKKENLQFQTIQNLFLNRKTTKKEEFDHF